MNNSGIMVLAQTEHGRATGLSLEMLGRARVLGNSLGGDIAAVVFGGDMSGIGAELIGHGADTVYLVDGDLLEPYQADAWLPDLAQIVTDAAPALVMIGDTSVGGDLAPRLAFRLGSAVATGCEIITHDGDRLLFTRACYGGKAREVVSFTTAPLVITVKSKTQSPLARDDARTGAIVKRAPTATAADIRTSVVSQTREVVDGRRLENATTVVAGGGGLGGPEGFEAATELADALGGAVGASRVACDMGWCPPHYQIGLSGKTVAPQLYIAIGISGAGQHMAGCANAKAIVAINSDPDAPIFGFAWFGVVGEHAELIPALISAIKKIKRLCQSNWA